MGVSIIYQHNGQDVALSFDAILREQHRGSAKVTRHPVERGAAVTDHVNEDPDVVSIEAAVSEVSVDGSAVARIARALDILAELKSAGELVTVATPHRTYDDMKLVSYDGGREAARSAQLRVSLTFERVRIVASQTVKVLERRAPSRAKDKVDDGKQVTTEAPASVANKSALVKIVDGDFNFFGGD